jgi:hypothetical protein
VGGDSFQTTLIFPVTIDSNSVLKEATNQRVERQVIVSGMDF